MRERHKAQADNEYSCACKLAVLVGIDLEE
jgi:hypothetical protein